MKIADLIRKGESDTLEFKLNFNKDASISVGAMANHKGGYVMIGVDDNSQVIGDRQHRMK